MQRSLTAIAGALLVAAVIGFAAYRLSHRSIATLTSSDVPLVLPGTTFEPELTATLVQRASAAQHDGRPGDFLWEECVHAAGVFSMARPEGADWTWRNGIVDGWVRSSGWPRLMYEEGGDILGPPGGGFELNILADDDAFSVPLDVLTEVNRQKLLVLALEERCPDPDPRWRQVARAALRWVRE